MSSSPSDSDRSAEIDAAIAAWYLAVERGERPDREAFLQQHPHLADELRQFLGDFERFHERADPLTTSGTTCCNHSPRQSKPSRGVVYVRETQTATRSGGIHARGFTGPLT